MNRKLSILNVSVSIIFKVILFFFAIFSKRLLIRFVGNDANGIYALYLNIVGVLSIAELGVGTAISFSMYKPIVNNEDFKVAGLYNLYENIYKIIGIVIFVIGLLITPFLHLLINNYTPSFNYQISYIMVLISTAFTYVYSSKISLVNAYKNNYITTTIISVGQIINYSLQIFFLYLFKSFELFVICKIISEILQAICIDIYAKKNYAHIINTNNKIDNDTRTEIIKNIKAMFLHKIGEVFINSTDSIIISTFVSVHVLGLYSNYTTIVIAMAGILGLLFSPLTSIVGHLCAERNRNSERTFHFFYFVNYAVGCIFYLGYYSIIDNLITLFFGENLIMQWDIPFIITLNYFIQFMRKSVLLFRDATGAFYNDRWKPLIEGILNLILSLMLVKSIGVTGVIIATIITNLVICHIVEPWVLYKNVFHKNPVQYYIVNYIFIGLFIVMIMCLNIFKQSLNNIWFEIIVNGLIAVGLSIIPILLLLIFYKIFIKKVT